jgi:hypothetical protein
MAQSSLTPITRDRLDWIGRHPWMAAVFQSLRATGYCTAYHLLFAPNAPLFEFLLSEGSHPRLTLRIERENLVGVSGFRDGYVALLQLEVAPRAAPLVFRIDRIGLDIRGASKLMDATHPSFLAAAIARHLIATGN